MIARAHRHAAAMAPAPRPGRLRTVVWGVVAVACYLAISWVSAMAMVVVILASLRTDLWLTMATTSAPDAILAVWIGLSSGAATWTSATLVRWRGAGSGRWVLAIPVVLSASWLLVPEPGIPRWTEALKASIAITSSIVAIWRLTATSTPRRSAAS